MVSCMCVRLHQVPSTSLCSKYDLGSFDRNVDLKFDHNFDCNFYCNFDRNFDRKIEKKKGLVTEIKKGRFGTSRIKAILKQKGNNAVI